MSSTGVIFLVGGVIGVINLGFIVPNLIYAGQGSLCVTTIPDGISFSLSTWLQVDAYMRIAIIGLVLLAGFISCCSA